MIKREEVNVSNELTLLSNAIMDNSVCASIYHRYKSGELRTGHFTKEYKNIFRWIIRYFGKHSKAPKKSIQSIYENKKKNLSSDQRELTEAYLERLAEDYIDNSENAIDPEYIQQEILPNFIREREISYLIEKAQNKIDHGQPEEAESLVSSYKQIVSVDEDENLGIIMPLTKEDLKNDNGDTFSEEDIVYRFEDNQEAIKSIVGDLRRGWVVAVTGIEKAGKSYLLEEMGYTAAIYQDRKVLKINLELTETLQRERLRKRITGATDSWQFGDNIYPIFDCENNQYGTCNVKKKHGGLKELFASGKKKPLIENPSLQVIWEKNKKWVTCENCRNRTERKNAIDTRRFLPCLFFDHSVLKEVNKRIVRRTIRKYDRFSNLDNYRIKCFPRFSVTFDEVRSFILRYIDKFQWEPDMIILDYLDITADEHADKRIDVDNKWKKASGLAGELNCLILNADQANKASRTQYAIDKTSTSESKTKDGHLDVRIAINQTDYEKELNVARMNTLFHRHFNFNERREVLITQRLEVSQPILDSVRIYEREKKYKVVNKKYL
jgi:hypothetical protein